MANIIIEKSKHHLMMLAIAMMTSLKAFQLYFDSKYCISELCADNECVYMHDLTLIMLNNPAACKVEETHKCFLLSVKGHKLFKTQSWRFILCVHVYISNLT